MSLTWDIVINSSLIAFFCVFILNIKRNRDVEILNLKKELSDLNDSFEIMAKGHNQHRVYINCLLKITGADLTGGNDGECIIDALNEGDIRERDNGKND